MLQAPKVILLIEMSTAYGRGMLRGIARYINHYGPWQIYREPPFYIDMKNADEKKSRMLRWQADGMIVREPHRHLEIIQMGIPTIISPNKLPGIPAIVTDYRRIGRMAADHLIERKYRHFGFCGFDDMPWSRNREKGFTDRLAEVGFPCHSYRQPASEALRLWENEQPCLADWLRSLPKPVGVMACNDDRGQNIIETCKLIGLHVPEEVAVIGVDNDELVCNLTDPTLSSSALNPEKDGYDAARLLDRLMAGENLTQATINNPPTHVVTRQSTDSLAITDPDIAQAVRYIKQNARRNIQVADVASALAVSRRTLGRKFRKILGSTIHEQIKRARTETIARILIETDLSISRIAQELDFPGGEHLARYFRQEKGLTPREFRKKYRSL